MTVLLAALVMRAVVPVGYMVSHAAGEVRISFCSGTVPAARDSQAIAAIRQLEAIAAKNNAGHEPAQEAAKACPYGVLSHGTVAGADPSLLAAAVAFVLALGLAVPTLPTPRKPQFLVPPLRAPPAAL